MIGATTKLAIERLEEPILSFNEGKGPYCKLGLTHYGPFDASKPAHSEKIILGIIGSKDLVEKTQDWIKACNREIESIPHDVKQVINKDLFPDFPGADIAFGTEIITGDSYIQIISTADIIRLPDSKKSFEYQNALLQIFHEKLSKMVENNETKPNVILCALTNEMYGACDTAGNYHKRIRRTLIDPNQLNLFQDIDLFNPNDITKPHDPFYRNFRSALKKTAMDPKIGIPTQILLESTIDPHNRSTQNAATKAWNFCTGIYYKSGKQPWILDEIDSNTCYLGISFFHKKNAYSDDVFTSMANLFAKDFEDIVFKGMRASYDRTKGGPYLTKEQALSLIEQALKIFYDVKGFYPKRIVIHKTSSFEEEEIKGFEKILHEKNILYDFVSLTKSSFKLIRHGTMPIPRGTFVNISDTAFFLYTKGFVPELGTYPGVHVPAPFVIKKAAGDSSYKIICQEILALTKLNWNTADFCCGLPITLGFARSVGDVLKEFEDDDEYEPQKSYRFYM